MVAIKTSLALPSLNKSTSSRSNSPAPSPAPSENGQKRAGLSMLDALPRSRSRSGEGKKRSVSGGSAVPGMQSLTSTAPPAAGTQTASHSGTLRPKLASLLSGRSTPNAVPSTPQVGSPTVPVGPHGPSSLASVSTVPTPAHSGSHNTGGNTPSLNGSVAISTLEASYVTKVGMTLNDAVNKVFPSQSSVVMGAVSHAHTGDATVVYKGLCAPRADRARAVGQVIVRELHTAVNDQYLLRSLLRSAVLKSLSIFLSRLESLIITPAMDGSILTVSRNLKEAENPPLSQRYTFLLLRSAWELKKGLVKACANVPSVDGRSEGAMPKFVKETLGPWITKIDLLANKIWQPILLAIKEEAVRLVVHQGQEPGMSPSNSTAQLAVPAAASGPRSLSLSRASTATTAAALLGTTGPVTATTLNSPHQLQAPYLRDLASLLAATTRTFAWLSVSDIEHQKWKVSVASTIIWKMLLTTSSKRIDSGELSVSRQRRSSPPPLAASSSEMPPPLAATKSVAQLSGNSHAPPARRSMSAMGMGRLRGTSTPGKRSPSPPRSSAEVTATKIVAEVEAFEAIIERFVSSILHAPHAHQHAVHESTNPNEASCALGKDCLVCKARYIPLDVDDSDDEEALPREAMQEAMTALSSFIVVLRAFAVEQREPVKMLLRAVEAVDDISLEPELCPNLIRALDTLPPLILLQTLVSRVPGYYNFRLPYELWSTTWKDYEQTMKGFHTGEEWVGEVGWELLKECRRISDRLAAEHGDEFVDEDGWIELLRLAITELAEVDDLDGDGDAPASNVTVSAGNAAIKA